MHFRHLPGLLPVALVAACIAAPLTVRAQDQTILKICETVETEETARFLDLADLERMEEARFTTSTIWTEGEIEFHGVPMGALLDQMEITAGTLELIAVNDYFVEIPVDEARESAAIIAYRMNGELMSRRDKGPLWLVYPFDSDVKYQSETYYSKSIWQIDRIKVLSE